eukprot:16447123-Heterocapsa_arctica.AAC.1
MSPTGANAVLPPGITRSLFQRCVATGRDLVAISADGHVPTLGSGRLYEPDALMCLPRDEMVEDGEQVEVPRSLLSFLRDSYS